MDWTAEEEIAVTPQTQPPPVPPRKKTTSKPQDKVHLREVASSLFADKLKKRLSTRKSKGRSFHYKLPDIQVKVSDYANPKILKSMSKHETSRQELMLRFILEENAYSKDLKLIQTVRK